MTITELFRCHVLDIAHKLGVPACFAGEAFIAPQGPHLVCDLDPGAARAAALGPDAPTRLDGALSITARTLAGNGLQEAENLAASVAALFPPGSFLAYDGAYGAGDFVFSAPVKSAPQEDAGRVGIQVKIPFCAIIFKKTRQS